MWGSRRVVGTAIVGVGLVAATALPVTAAPGDLDPSFGGGDGQIAVKAADRPGGAYAMALQPDGKVVEAGYVDLSQTNEAWGLVRLNANGTRDATFGNDGSVVTNWTSVKDEAWAVLVLPTGKIVVAGYAGGAFAVARYTRSGKLDPHFGGGDGKVTVDFTPNRDSAWDVARAPDGKLVLAGQAGPSSHTVVALARLKPGGAIDHSFGGGDGMATEDLGPSYAWDIVVLDDGSIVATGNSDGGSLDAAMITRFTPAGEVDSSFGDAGSWVAAAPDNAYANAIVRLASGKYALGAAVGDFTNGFDVGLFRFDADGHPDTAFGTNGLVTHDFGGTEFVDDMVRAGTSLLLAVPWVPDGQPERMAVVRLHADGSTDDGFGDHGIAVAGFPTAATEGVAVRGDGRIVAGGYGRANGTSDSRFVAARFLGA